MIPQKAGFFPVVEDRNFSMMWLAMLVSTFGTFSLLVVISTEIYRQTNSALISGSVFAAQWVIPIFFTFGISRILRLPGIFKTLGLSELAGASTSVTAGIALINGNLPVLFGALVARGFVESITKSGRVVALKKFTGTEHLEAASSIFNSSYYLGIAAGTLLTPILMEHLSILQISFIDGLTFIVSAIIYIGLFRKNKDIEKDSRKEQKINSSELFQSLLTKKELAIASLLAIFNVALFQGYHNLARTALPMGHYHSGATGVVAFQVINIAGIMAGMTFVSAWLIRRKKDIFSSPMLWFALAALMVPLPILSQDQNLGLFLYFCFAFCFEVAFVLLQNQIVLAASREELSILSLFNQSAMSAGMALCVLVAGKSADVFGLGSITIALSLFAFLLVSVFLFFEKHWKTE